MRRLTLTILAGLALILTLFVSVQLQENLPEKIAKKQAGRQRQTEGRPAPDVIAHWQAFAARSKKPIAVSWNPQTGTPESIFGELSPANDRVSAKLARRFMSDNANLFKFQLGSDDLALGDDIESPMGRHFVFQQSFQGVPVYGARAAVHFNKSGMVVGHRSRRVSRPAAVITPISVLAQCVSNATILTAFIGASSPSSILIPKTTIPAGSQGRPVFIDVHCQARAWKCHPPPQIAGPA